ncbi:DUF3285 domain-containing protein [Prochlorococcus sp. MIT 1223]|uniref:DUF3285 domain-containing protein n=1 Tax=Prochlorococcus sp. MIT 1223 TaxID=3096217 RepID=UPI002A74AB89|nr:DUF3285 domain-containing protein [Prochlorococcus sp. MIT 1223]
MTNQINTYLTEKIKSSKNAPPPSFVKLAMRNMVRKGSQSIMHLGLTFFGFIVFILLIATLARPHIPQ